jgi:hypothetical protein
MCAAELRIQLKLLIRCAGHREAQLELAIGDGAPRLPTVLDDGDDCGTRRCRAVVERRSRKGRIRRDPEISRGAEGGEPVERKPVHHDERPSPSPERKGRGQPHQKRGPTCKFSGCFLKLFGSRLLIAIQIRVYI